MREIDIRKTQFTVADFLSWQRDGSLVLKPQFQRRSVWRPGAQSFFMDTVVRGLPAPIIYLRQNVDLKTQRSLREVVDGQQRLRTILSFVDPESLDDYDEKKDAFLVSKVHNSDIAGKTFERISSHFKKRILEYEFSTHVLPISIEDRDVLEMFARLNATGVKLNPQELRNAQFYGEFKNLMYELAHQQLERWRDWRIFSDDQISRMKEVEMTSDLVINMLDGLTGKSQPRIRNYYRKYDAKFSQSSWIAKRFEDTMDEIDRVIGDRITDTVYTGEVYFFTLFVFVYDKMYGLGSSGDRLKAKRLPLRLKDNLVRVSQQFRDFDVPDYVLDAVRRAATDYGRRQTRLAFMSEQCA